MTDKKTPTNPLSMKERVKIPRHHMPEQDPVVRARLKAIAEDQRYQPDVIETAKQVLQENVPDEDLIAAGVL